MSIIDFLKSLTPERRTPILWTGIVVENHRYSLPIWRTVPVTSIG